MEKKTFGSKTISHILNPAYFHGEMCRSAQTDRFCRAQDQCQLRILSSRKSRLIGTAIWRNRYFFGVVGFIIPTLWNNDFLQIIPSQEGFKYERSYCAHMGGRDSVI